MLLRPSLPPSLLPRRLCRLYRVWTLVALLSPGVLVLIHVFDFIVLGVLGDEVLQSLGHLVLQSVRLVFCDLQKNEEAVQIRLVMNLVLTRFQ